MQRAVKSPSEKQILLGRRLLIGSALIAVLMVMIRNHFYLDRWAFQNLVLVSPVVAVAVVAAYLPNKLTLGLASLMWLFIALYLPEAFTTEYELHATPEFRRYTLMWDQTADVAQIIATCAGAAGLGFMWASIRARGTNTH